MAYRGSGGNGANSGTTQAIPPSSDAYASGGYSYVPPDPQSGLEKANLSPEMQALIVETADALQISPTELATFISFETGGTMDPLQSGPTTKWGQHRGLIQFGEPQAKQYGVDFSSPEAALRSQLGKDGAVVKYALDRGFVPGKHNGLNLYATINAGGPDNINASDTAAGGTAGTVADKYYEQMGAHRAKFGGLDWRTGLPDAQTAGSAGANTGIPEEKTPEQKRAEGWQYFAQTLSDPTPQVKMDPITNAQVQDVGFVDLVDFAIPEF